MLVLSAFLKLFLFYVSGCFACCMPGLHACACAGQKRTSYSPEPGSWVIVSHHVGSGNRTWVLERAASALQPWVISPVPHLIFYLNVSAFPSICGLLSPAGLSLLKTFYTVSSDSLHFSFPALYSHPISISLLNWSSMLLTFYWTSLMLSFTLLSFPSVLSTLLSSPVLSASVCFCFYSLLGQSSFFFFNQKTFEISPGILSI